MQSPGCLIVFVYSTWVKLLAKSIWYNTSILHLLLNDGSMNFETLFYGVKNAIANFTEIKIISSRFKCWKVNTLTKTILHGTNFISYYNGKCGFKLYDYKRMLKRGVLILRGHRHRHLAVVPIIWWKRNVAYFSGRIWKICIARNKFQHFMNVKLIKQLRPENK